MVVHRLHQLGLLLGADRVADRLEERLQLVHLRRVHLQRRGVQCVRWYGEATARASDGTARLRPTTRYGMGVSDGNVRSGKAEGRTSALDGAV